MASEHQPLTGAERAAAEAAFAEGAARAATRWGERNPLGEGERNPLGEGAAPRAVAEPVAFVLDTGRLPGTVGNAAQQRLALAAPLLVSGRDPLEETESRWAHSHTETRPTLAHFRLPAVPYPPPCGRDPLESTESHWAHSFAISPALPSTAHRAAPYLIPNPETPKRPARSDSAPCLIPNPEPPQRPARSGPA